ncbi:DUF4266 domain-containing protein [Chitinophaga filiformis]|uniref:DUF4266 domain-containing protein n=1 Tax=Chitinophaga filiformis TaxID=104663 RepID=A0ABY4I5W3_CHIFI|nr:DUF4266 domain-containing protein [Chitinophaga filiformis]UPK71232.1 DUF4266 domain-containing protein [Chitinophaga filiformis]
MQKANSSSILLGATGTLLVLLVMQSCATVKPYQRMYLNDESMQLGKRGIEKFDENVHTYREGSSGGGSGKSSGGCGCN